jgi:hypothetical protein
MNTLSGTLVRSAKRCAYGVLDRVALRPARRIGQIMRDTRAVTSIEFAAISLPFFTLIMGTMGLGLWFFCAAAIDVGVYGAGRQVQTGQITGTLASLSSSTFAKNYVCANISPVANIPVVPCDGTNPAINMAVVTDFTQLLTQTPIPHTSPQLYSYRLKNISSLGTKYCTPGVGAIVYIQAVYTVPVFGAIITYFGGDPLISGTTVEVEHTPNAPGSTCKNPV